MNLDKLTIETAENDFQLIYERHIHKIFNFVLRMTGNRGISEDITQETFEKAFLNFNKFRGESDLSTWLYSIARNTCYRHYKSEKKSNFNSFETLINYSSNSMVGNQFEELEKQYYIEQVKTGCLLGLLRCLSFNQRISFILNVFNEIPTKEISSIIGKSQNATRILIHRAKANIKNFLCENCSLYQKSKKCRCENLVSFSLKQGWIEKYNPNINPEKIENEIRLFKDEVRLYQSLPTFKPGKSLIEKIKNYMKISSLTIFLNKKVK